ncbi:lipid-A-disaccharide synthase [Legionella bononiensis]|uniref:Lipid-A-disaccharide synthase n=1 Tax=Legionella bononiensis TaxID=2793102 RepID=A0ABS1WFR4_9GAMM|nr:lipid-A-disaccharide synthase [Legionella bononiensis]MBL7528191.1 lipid-A-disaccharide synthase [Legionella bononiensis]MBL7562667.1 lipid-A-disaccharide synthase [Legionella bononiensis]
MSLKRPLRIAIIAGEPSGDLLGAGLIRELKKHDVPLVFEGIGGTQMIKEGMQSFVNMERLSVMGIGDVLKRYPELYRIRQQLLNQWILNPPDIFIGIDYSNFNLWLAKNLKPRGVKTVQYVSPKVWAWRQKRVYHIKKTIDMILTLFPFEEEFYQRFDVPAQFVGHPLADEIEMEMDTRHKKIQLGLNSQDKHIAVLPGSRAGEIKYMGPLFLDVMQEISLQNQQVQFMVPLANSNLRDIFQKQLDNTGIKVNVQITTQSSREVMAAADVVLAKSGTTTLEAMLLKKPMVVAFKWGALTHALIAPQLKIPFISLPNLLANRELVPEYLQTKALAHPIAQQVLHLLQTPEQDQLIQQFREIHKKLRQNASEKAALAVLKILAVASA